MITPHLSPRPAAVLTSTLTSSLRPTLVTVFVVVLGGCTSMPVASEKMAVAEASVQHADTHSTRENAAGELQIATNKLADARLAMTARDYARASQLAEQAELDAQVAELHAQSARSRMAARESQEAARVLREEINRNTVR